MLTSLHPSQTLALTTLGGSMLLTTLLLRKSEGFLFNCLATRAVHVEIISSMGTSSCVMGVEWCVSRRIKPAMIWSDNRTNFFAAEKSLRKIIEKWNIDNMAAELVPRV